MHDKGYRSFQISGYIIITMLTLVCLIPFLLIVSASFSSEASIIEHGYTLYPRDFSLQAYQTVLKSPKSMLTSYKVTIIVTVAGTMLGLFVTAMTAYVIGRKQFKYRNKVAFMFYFTNIFSGGMIPTYILIATYLQLKNTYLAMILPPILNAWFIILMRNFMKSIPDSIEESAKIDGASDFTIFLRLYIPLSVAGLATVGLFMALGYWNNWFTAMLYIEVRELYPLQYYLHDVLNKAKAFEIAAQEANIPMPEFPKETMKMAMAVFTTGPILLVYPFVQKYFVKGLTIGSIKG